MIVKENEMGNFWEDNIESVLDIAADWAYARSHNIENSGLGNYDLTDMSIEIRKIIENAPKQHDYDTGSWDWKRYINNCIDRLEELGRTSIEVELLHLFDKAVDIGIAECNEELLCERLNYPKVETEIVSSDTRDYLRIWLDGRAYEVSVKMV